jgi:tripartite-type tricarboxylate transporter receptor subunit TctC
VSSLKRSSAAPDVPTLNELGYTGFNGVPWVAIVAPAHTPAPIVAKLNAEINKALATKEVREYFIAQGAEPMPMSPEEFGAFMKAELAKWTRAVKDSGAKVE